MPRHNYRYWTPEEIALLGTMPDRELAKIRGCPFPGVTQKRRKLGIPSYGKTHPSRATERKLVKLATLSDEELTGSSLEKLVKKLRISGEALREELKKRGFPVGIYKSKWRTSLEGRIRLAITRAAIKEAGEERGFQSALARVLHVSREMASQMVQKASEE